jgi:hypothetical protein
MRPQNDNNALAWRADRLKRQFPILRRFLRLKLERARRTFFPSHPSKWRILADEAEQHETIIVVHGTFAWRKERHGDEWWQWPLRRSGALTQSNEPEPIPFVSYLKTKAGGRYRIRPARWPQGDNSEHVRRAAGRKLLAMIRTLDDRGRKYHIISHSHGGNVVWHALRQSTNRPLKHLQSWTTVATPFLTFKSSGTNWAAVCGLLVAAFTCIGLLPRLLDVSDSFDRVLGTATLSSLLGFWMFAALWGGVVLALLYLAIRPWIRSSIERNLALQSLKATDLYGGKWCGIWHARDEAYLGLSSSLGEIRTFFPRTTWLGGTIGPIMDQLTWFTLIRRKGQGCDISNALLSEVRRKPEGFPRRPPLPPEVQQALIARCEDRLGPMASKVRETVGQEYLAGRTDLLFKEVGQRIDLGFLLHNSYFDAPHVRDVIAGHVASAATRNRMAPDSERAETGPNEAVERRSGRLWWLIAGAALLTAVAILFVAVLSRDFIDTRILPYTEHGIGEEVAQRVTQPEMINSLRPRQVAGLLERLAEHDLFSSLECDLVCTLDQMSDSTEQRDAIEFIGGRLKFLGNVHFREIQKFAKERFPEHNFDWDASSASEREVPDAAPLWQLKRGTFLSLALTAAIKDDGLATTKDDDPSADNGDAASKHDASAPSGDNGSNDIQTAETDLFKMMGAGPQVARPLAQGALRLAIGPGDPCVRFTRAIELLFLSMDAYRSETRRQDIDTWSDTAMLKLDNELRAAFAGGTRLAGCVNRPPAPFIKLYVLAHGRRLPLFLAFLKELIGSAGRGDTLSHPLAAYGEEPGKTIAAHFKLIENGLPSAISEIQTVVRDTSTRDWHSRLHLARAIQTLANDPRYVRDKRQLTEQAIAVGRSAVRILKTLSAPEFSKGIVDAMNLLQQLTVGGRTEWQRASDEIIEKAQSTLFNSPNLPGTAEEIDLVALIVRETRPGSDIAAKSRELGINAWNAGTDEKDLRTRLDALFSLSRAMRKLDADLAARWTGQIGFEARRFNLRNLRSKVQSSAVGFLVENGKLNLAVKQAELIEQPVQAYHAFSLILDQLAPRTWSKLSSALGFRGSGARGRSAAR